MPDATNWMPFYIGDYMRDTRHLSMAQHGIYIHLLMKMWADGGSLPSGDFDLLRRMIGADREEWDSNFDGVATFFYIRDGRLRNKRVDKEMTRAKTIKESRKKAGIASAESRKNQTNSNGYSTPVQQETNTRKTFVGTNAQQKTNTCSTQNVALSALIINEPFTLFWSLYPRKVGKKEAKKAFAGALGRATPGVIINGLRLYRFSRDPEGRPHAATWLNNDRWEFEEDTPPPRLVASKETDLTAMVRALDLFPDTDESPIIEHEGFDHDE